MNIKILWPIHVWHAFIPPWCCSVMSMLLIIYYLCKMSMLLKTIIYISFISFQVLEVCKNFFITQNCFSITTKCKRQDLQCLHLLLPHQSTQTVCSNTLPKFTTLNGEMEVPFNIQHSTTCLESIMS